MVSSVEAGREMEMIVDVGDMCNHILESTRGLMVNRDWKREWINRCVRKMNIDG